jgi:hypothetical protein
MIASYACDRDRTPNALHFNLELGDTPGERLEPLDLCIACVAKEFLALLGTMPLPEKRRWVERMRHPVAHPVAQEETRG